MMAEAFDRKKKEAAAVPKDNEMSEADKLAIMKAQEDLMNLDEGNKDSSAAGQSERIRE
jgi:hypothetical protein